MFTAADVIELLGQRRRRKSLRPEVPGQLPPGWQQWLDAMPQAEAAVTGAWPQSIVDELAQRALDAPPPRSPQLNRWQAFATLWRQQWQPPVRDERGLRRSAIAFSGGLHCLLILMLLWLAWVRIDMPAPAAAEGDQVVQVEFIGRGTPKERGGGAPSGARPEPASTSASRAASRQPPVEAPAAQPAPSTASASSSTAPAPQPDVAPAQPPQPPAPQPLQVTEVAVPDTDFVLPPPRPREATLPQLQVTVPEVRQPTPRIAEVDVPRPAVVEAQRSQPRLQVVTPQLRAEAEPTPEQEAAVRLPQARARTLSVTNPELRVPAVQAQVRDIPMPDVGAAPASANSGETAPSASNAPGSAATAAAAGGPPSAAPGNARATSSGAGPATSAKPGAWPTPSRGDNWGASTRNRPGGQPGGAPGTPGLFNADGRPRLVDVPPPGRNAPGSEEQRRVDLDRAGTWLRRPPYDYTPTVFDKYWRPRETLLQEWVRKGIRKLSIPIPGTDRKIECVVSILQLGGGCGLADPNKNEQPATARPPPDIPFKPELQEDNGSVKP